MSEHPCSHRLCDFRPEPAQAVSIFDLKFIFLPPLVQKYLKSRISGALNCSLKRMRKNDRESRRLHIELFAFL